MEALKKCLNPKVLLGLAVVAIGVAIFAPKALAAALPLLLIAACPLSMVVMMIMMGRKNLTEQSNKGNSMENKK